jgi:hypothetical protein
VKLKASGRFMVTRFPTLNPAEKQSVVHPTMVLPLLQLPFTALSPFPQGKRNPRCALTLKETTRVQPRSARLDPKLGIPNQAITGQGHLPRQCPLLASSCSKLGSVWEHLRLILCFRFENRWHVFQLPITHQYSLEIKQHKIRELPRSAYLA